MIRELRKKFIITAMAAVTVLLVGLLAALNVMSYSYVNKRADMILEEIALKYNDDPALYEDMDAGLYITDKGTVREGVQVPPDADGTGSSGAQQGMEFDGDFTISDDEGDDAEINVASPVTIQLSFMSSDVSMNEVLGSAYYTVTMDTEGMFIYTDLSRIANVSADEAQDKAEKIFASGKTKGWDGKVKFLVSKDSQENHLFVFLDREPEMNSQQRFVVFSVLIALACTGIMYIFVTLVSKKILQPIIDNMEMQKNFITNASHELKTPLAVIQSNTEALELYNGDNKWTNNIKDQIKNLSVLLNNMLTLAKAQEGTSMKKENIDISNVIREYVKSFIEPARQKNVTFSDMIEEGMTIKGTTAQAVQLVSIILGNALKYCDNDSVINVEAFSADRNMVMKVSNACSVLPDCEPERLFERFYRPDSTRYSGKYGNGIGLSAARAIVESFGGTISCDYEDDNRILFTIIIKKM